MCANNVSDSILGASYSVTVSSSSSKIHKNSVLFENKENRTLETFQIANKLKWIETVSLMPIADAKINATEKSNKPHYRFGSVYPFRNSFKCKSLPCLFGFHRFMFDSKTTKYYNDIFFEVIQPRTDLPHKWRFALSSFSANRITLGFNRNLLWIIRKQ